MMNARVVVVFLLAVGLGLSAYLVSRNIAVEPAPKVEQPPREPPQSSNPKACKGAARCFIGIIKNIVDGDTLDIGDFRIRLALTNTPEKGNLGYKEATAFTASLCKIGYEALVDEDDGQIEGSFGRMIAVVYCNGRNLNAELVINGHANVLSRFCSVSEFAKESWARTGCK